MGTFENDWKQDGVEKNLKKNDLRNAFHVMEREWKSIHLYRYGYGSEKYGTKK